MITLCLLLAGSAYGADLIDDLGAIALDDRRPEGRRAKALDALGDLNDPGVLWILRAAARDRVPAVQRAAIEAAAGFEEPDAVALMHWVLTDPQSELSNRQRALNVLAEHGTPQAGDALWEAASDRRVPARLRASCSEALSAYPDTVTARGVPKNAVDTLGGAAFVLANGLGGGIALSSVGVWGQFDGSTAIGAVGGAAMGLGGGGLYVGKRPLTTGQGLAYASGVSWGLAAGAWTTSAAHGPWSLLERDTPRWRTAVDAGAAYRLGGVLGGAALGALWMGRDPEAWDVLEVDLAGYLGSAIFLSGTGLLVWDGEQPPEESPGFYSTSYPTYTTGSAPGTRTFDPWAARDAEQRAWDDAHRPQAQIMSASNLVGAGVGLATGFALRDRWKLSWEDAAFATTLGLEAAWIGNFTPDAVGIDDRYLKGTVRLPWNAAIIGGLVIAELKPMPWQTTAVTAASALSFNALGAGVPLLVDSSNDRLLAQVMVPAGAVGTVAGVLAAPWLDPHGGEWMMTGVGTAVAAAHGPLLGNILVEGGSFSDDQMGGLTLLFAGSAPPVLLTIGHFADPAADDMMVVGSAWGWGAAYGAAAPFAFRTGASGGQTTLVSAIAGDAFLVGASVALLDRVGLEPRHTLVPQLTGVAGGTVGALSVAMFDSDAEDVVLGGMIGATIGLVSGGVGTALSQPNERRGGRALRLPGLWQPAYFPASVETPVERIGVRVVGL